MGGEMNFPLNSDWNLSAKGNYWKKYNGKMLIVGGSSSKGFWVRVEEAYLKDHFKDLEEAMSAAERGE